MGEVLQYHITMLVTSEQEDAIRTVFKDKNWPCWLKVLSDESVAIAVQNGFTDLFPVMTQGQDGGIGQTVFTEIKSEVIELDTSSDSDSFNKARNDSSVVLEQSSTKCEPTVLSDTDDTMDYDMSNNSLDEASLKTDDISATSTAVSVADRTDESKESQKEKTETKPGTDEVSRIICPMCKIIYRNKKSLRRHYVTKHNIVLPEFECKICKKQFEKKEALWEHRRRDHDPADLAETITALDMGQYPPEELEKMGNLKCEICCNFYPHARSLRRHKYKVHREALPKWDCQICGNEYNTRDELWKHKREKGHKTSLWSLGNYQCDACGKIYTRYDSFSEHRLTCQKSEEEKQAIRQFPCDICGLVFKSSLRVRSHKRGVHVTDPAICDECGTVCKNKRALLVHRRRHDNKNRKFGCDDCGKSFFNTTLLAQHVRTHTKEKPFKCPLCDYKCAIKQNIHKHSLKVHKVQCQAVKVDELKERLIKQEDDRIYSGGKFGVQYDPGTTVFQALQSQSIEMNSQSSRSSFKADFDYASSGQHLNLN